MNSFVDGKLEGESWKGKAGREKLEGKKQKPRRPRRPTRLYVKMRRFQIIEPKVSPSEATSPMALVVIGLVRMIHVDEKKPHEANLMEAALPEYSLGYLGIYLQYARLRSFSFSIGVIMQFLLSCAAMFWSTSVHFILFLFIFSINLSEVSAAVAVKLDPTEPCVVIDGGSVYCWNSWNKDAPIVDGISNAVAVSGGRCALLADGTVKCWGSGQYGKLGNGSDNDSNVPVAVSRLTNVIALSAGSSHACAVTAEGKVLCWGFNNRYQLGNSVNDNNGSKSNVPLVVLYVSDAVDVSVGERYSCALISGGTVSCWGQGNNGRLGDGSIDLNKYANRVKGLRFAVALSAGKDHACALTITGVVACWGRGNEGQLGNGNLTDVAEPVLVSGLNNVVDISAGDDNTCALVTDGTVYCWGKISYPTTKHSVYLSPTPTQVSGLSNIVALSTNFYRTCALKDGGSVLCWGRYVDYVDGKSISTGIPTQVGGLAGNSPAIEYYHSSLDRNYSATWHALCS